MGQLDGGQACAERRRVDAFEVSDSEREDVLVHGWVASKLRSGLRRV
jgi:hypothetical protein